MNRAFDYGSKGFWFESRRGHQTGQDGFFPLVLFLFWAETRAKPNKTAATKPMTITYNDTFKLLLTEYSLPEDFSFSFELPAEVQSILDDQILFTGLGVTLKSFNKRYTTNQNWINQSIIEDSENHFHVDWHIEPADNRKAFMLGIKTLTLLADKFQKEEIKGIRFWYSFQTPELGRLWAKQNNLGEDDDEHFISDRLSFYKLRPGENVISTNESENKFWAILIIDI